MRTPSLTAFTNLHLGALGAVFGLIAVELLIIGLLYDEHAFDFKCQETAPVWFCVFAARIVPRTLAVLAGMILFVFARPAAIARLFETAGPFRTGFATNIVGFLLLLWPVFVVSDASSISQVSIAILSWSLGGSLIVAGLMLILAPWSAWGQFLKENGITLALLLAFCLALPDFGRLLDLLWQIEWVTNATFASVAGLLSALGYSVVSDRESYGIGADDFHVIVGWQCSGVEGFLLITAFLTLYIGLYRRNLRFPHVLTLYPLGLLLSWCFNVPWITIPLVIGIEGHPELAVARSIATLDG
jgi:exosortase E/protease (VPEID-CTERM system)